MVLIIAVKTHARRDRKRSVATHEFCSYEHKAECELTYCMLALSLHEVIVSDFVANVLHIWMLQQQ